MTAPEARPSGLDGNARGLMVLGIGLVVGFLLLLNAGSGSAGTSSDASSTNDPPVTTAPLDSDTTTSTTGTTLPTSDRAASEVAVVVFNGGGPTGVAETTSTTIGEQGYTMGTFGNSPVQVEATTVFYAEDYQEDATAIALLLGKSTDAVKPLADADLGGAEGENNVVVIMGPDAAPVSGG